jgi:hypothetical protein
MDRASDILGIISARKAAGEPFALATVVRTVAATAAKAGAKAVILPDGTISEGWIGGGCARAAVLKAAKDALADGKSRLVSVQPPDLLDQYGRTAGEEQGGVRFASNMCPSEGTMDIFVSRCCLGPKSSSADRARLPSPLPILPSEQDSASRPAHQRRSKQLLAISIGASRGMLCPSTNRAPDISSSRRKVVAMKLLYLRRSRSMPITLPSSAAGRKPNR